MNQDRKYEQLLHNIETLTQMVFDGYERGSNCTPQIVLKDGMPNGFRREESFPGTKFSGEHKISDLVKLLGSGHGDIRLIVRDNQVVNYIAGESIKAAV